MIIIFKNLHWFISHTYILEVGLQCLFLLQSKYAERSDAILLVIIPAKQAPDISSAKALRIAKEFDGESE